MDFEQGLTAELSTVIGLSGKVFPLKTPQKTAVPYLTYELTNIDRLESLATGHDGMVEATYQLDIFQTKYADLKSLMDLVIAKLKTIFQRNIGAIGPYIQALHIENEFETYESEAFLYHGVIEFIVSYTE